MADTRQRNAAPRLTPPGLGPDQQAPAGKNRLPWVWLFSGLLLAVALAVVLLLPSLVSQPVVERSEKREPTRPDAPETARDATLPSPTQPLKPPPQIEQRAQLVQQKQAAEALLERVLRRTAEMQAVNIENWAGEAYLALRQRTALADQALDQRQFQQAAAGYREVLAALDALQASMPERLAHALEAGRLALQETEAERAKRQFGIALALQPDNPVAHNGLRRAQTIEQVARLSAEAQALARGGQWQQAAAAYRRALDLDGEYAPAQTGLTQMENLLQERAFVNAMSDTLNALQEQNLEAAAQALEKAAQLRPEAAEVEDAQSRLAAARKARRLQQLSAAAQAAEEREDWAQAQRLYRQALALEPGALTAQRGLRLAEERIELHKNIDRYLQQPQRLQADQVLANAKALLQSTQAIQRPGARLQARRDQLQQLVAKAEQPVPVRIRSDGLTDVVIYRVGRFGRFQQHEVSLRPGAYTLVGSRDGFRDVRVTLVVRPGAPTEVQVICGERI